MSQSKILLSLWRDTKTNFRSLVKEVAMNERLPTKEELMKHQESIQDLVDIFETVETHQTQSTDMQAQSKSSESSSVNKKRKADNPPPELTAPADDLQEDDANPIKKLTRRVFTTDEMDSLWKAYVKNHYQFLSRDQLAQIAVKNGRTVDSVKHNLRKLVALHNDVPVERALDNPFTVTEDNLILKSYAENITDSYQSEATIVQDLVHELHREAEAVRNRLFWLKERQQRADRSFDATVAEFLRVPSSSRRNKYSYSELEDDIILSAHKEGRDMIDAANVLQRSRNGIQRRLGRLERDRGLQQTSNEGDSGHSESGSESTGSSVESHSDNSSSSEGPVPTTTAKTPPCARRHNSKVASFVEDSDQLSVRETHASVIDSTKTTAEDVVIWQHYQETHSEEYRDYYDTAKALQRPTKAVVQRMRRLVMHSKDGRRMGATTTMDVQTQVTSEVPAAVTTVTTEKQVKSEPSPPSLATKTQTNKEPAVKHWYEDGRFSYKAGPAGRRVRSSCSGSDTGSDGASEDSSFYKRSKR